jgi:ribosome-binding factor A
MADRRLKRIGALLRNEISSIIQGGLTGSHEAMLSVTAVEVAADLRTAKVFISIYGDEPQCEKSFKKLVSSKDVFTKEINKRVRLRRIPELHFIKDNSLEEGSRISSLLDKLEEERKQNERERKDN